MPRAPRLVPVPTPTPPAQENAAGTPHNVDTSQAPVSSWNASIQAMPSGWTWIDGAGTVESGRAIYRPRNRQSYTTETVQEQPPEQTEEDPGEAIRRHIASLRRHAITPRPRLDSIEDPVEREAERQRRAVARSTEAMANMDRENDESQEDEGFISNEELPDSPTYAYTRSVAPRPTIHRLVCDINDLISANARHKSTGDRLADMGWDKIFKHLRNEVKEAEDAINTDDDDNIIHELGDVLGIVIHAILKAGYTLEDAVEAEVNKLISRFEIVGPEEPSAGGPDGPEPPF